MAKNIEKYLNAEKVDISEWKKIASAALKDQNLEDLNKEIDKGLSIKPLYTSEDEEEDYSYSLRRGLKPNVNNYMPWYICTTIDHNNDSKILNGRILGELERGSNSIEISFFEINTLDKDVQFFYVAKNRLERAIELNHPTNATACKPCGA